MNEAPDVVLDASALLCLIFMEPGADRVEAAMNGAVISAVNYCEVMGKLIDHGIDGDKVAADLAELDIVVVSLDKEMAAKAASLRPQTRSAGLSLGDRCCLALAQRFGARAVTTDRAWTAIGERIGVAIDLVR